MRLSGPFFVALSALLSGCVFNPPSFSGAEDAIVAPRDAEQTDSATVAIDAEVIDRGVDLDADPPRPDAGFPDAPAGDVDPIDGGGGDAADADADAGFDAGDADSGIDAMSPFSYRPSNYDPNNINNWSFDLSVATAQRCTVVADGNPQLQGACGINPPQPIVVSQDSGEPAVLLAMSSLTVAPGGGIEINGDLPVIFLVSGNVSMNGTLDNSAVGSIAAAGAITMNCSRPAIDGTNGGSAGGGGGGGAGFGFAGGNGGLSAQNAANGSGGQSDGDDSIEPLRGGCPGGRGGDGNSTAGGIGGGGGGAVQISAAASLSIFGTIAASGGGGAGGERRAGGGGGGSGGAILLEAPQIAVPAGARVLTNGGGGGEGGAEDSAEPSGQAGFDGAGRTGAVAGGSMRNSSGGSGGEGGSPVGGASEGTQGTTGAAGGGGGGGSAGRVRFRASRICDISAVAFLSGAQRRDCP